MVDESIFKTVIDLVFMVKTFCYKKLKMKITMIQCALSWFVVCLFKFQWRV